MSSETSDRIELTFSARLATRAGIERVCAEARRHAYRGVTLPSSGMVPAVHLFEGSSLIISCLIGFPFGAADPDVKRFETEVAIDAGAQEIEIVPSLARLQDGDYSYVLRELRDISEAADERPVKVAIEPSLWNSPKLSEIVQMVLDSGTHYICTSLSDYDKVLEEVHTLRQLAGPNFGIKASAGSESALARELIDAGAHLIGLISS